MIPKTHNKTTLLTTTFLSMLLVGGNGFAADHKNEAEADLKSAANPLTPAPTPTPEASTKNPNDLTQPAATAASGSSVGAKAAATAPVKQEFTKSQKEALEEMKRIPGRASVIDKVLNARTESMSTNEKWVFFNAVKSANFLRHTDYPGYIALLKFSTELYNSKDECYECVLNEYASQLDLESHQDKGKEGHKEAVKIWNKIDTRLAMFRLANSHELYGEYAEAFEAYDHILTNLFTPSPGYARDEYTLDSLKKLILKVQKTAPLDKFKEKMSSTMLSYLFDSLRNELMDAEAHEIVNPGSPPPKKEYVESLTSAYQWVSDETYRRDAALEQGKSATAAHKTPS